MGAAILTSLAKSMYLLRYVCRDVNECVGVAISSKNDDVTVRLTARD